MDRVNTTELSTPSGAGSSTEAMPAAGFTVIPAIDLRGGRVVRLLMGDYARETAYADAPVALAEAWAAAGARWLHLVDLDGARSGKACHLDVLRAVAALGLRVQAGGGVRSEADLEAFLEAGASRVVVGSLALREPARVAGWLLRYGAERIVIALDARWRDGAWQLPSAGWTQDEPVDLRSLVRRYADAGARHLLSTDIARDGTLGGPNLGLYRDLRCWEPRLAVQASGGVRNEEDLASLREVGVAGAILGRALLEGRITLMEAMKC